MSSTEAAAEETKVRHGFWFFSIAQCHGTHLHLMHIMCAQPTPVFGSGSTFGAGTGFAGFTGVSNTSTAQNSEAAEGEEGDAAPEEECQAEFKPVVQLDEVETTTGEEEEESLLELYVPRQGRCSVFLLMIPSLNRPWLYEIVGNVSCIGLRLPITSGRSVVLGMSGY